MNNNIKNIVSYLFIVLLNVLPKAALGDASPSVFDMENVPDEFKDAIYDVPLAVRIEVDDNYFTDGLITISRKNFVRLIKFETSFERSQYNDEDKFIENLLKNGQYLGDCDCAHVLKVEYDPNTSSLALYTDGANNKSIRSKDLFSATEATGLILQNIFTGTKTSDSDSYSYIGSAATNIGSWTGYSNFNISQYTGSDSTYMLNDLYGQIDLPNNQLKVGFFTPNYSLSGGTYAVIPNNAYLSSYGISYGSSERFNQYGGTASLIPLTVTASQNGYVEIYKANQLIGTFPIKAGIQSIPTEGFPDGIYSVEVRLYEGGRLTSTSNSEINKAIGFYGSALKYKFFAGKKAYIRSPSINSDEFDDSFVQGASISYLFNPKFNMGLSLLRDGSEVSGAVSSTYDVSNNIRFYNNIYHSENDYGGDVQVMYNDNGIYSSLSTTYSNVKTPNSYFQEQTQDNNESLRSNLTMGGNIDRDQLYTTFSYDHKEKNKSISVGINYNLDEHFPLGSYLTASISHSMFKDTDTWNGTINFSIPIEIGNTRRSYGSIGIASQKNSAGDTSTALTADYSKSYDDGLIRNFSTNLNVAEKDINNTISTSFHTPSTMGSGYLSLNRNDNGEKTVINNSVGVNLNNALVIGPGSATLTSGNGLGLSNTGVLIDVTSSFDDHDLVAQVDGIGSIPLKSGTNFIPIQPYQKSTISYDLINGGEKGGATFDPPSERVSLYPGGVAVKKVSVMRTVTVLGRIVDAKNNIIRGVEVRNHAGFAIPESDGVFVLEMSIENPQISILKDGNVLCDIDYSEKVKTNTSTLINSGNIICIKNV